MKRRWFFQRKLVTRRRLLALGALAAATTLLPTAGSARAENVPDFRIIVHPENPSTLLSRDFLVDAFLKRVTRWSDGETIRAVDQKPSALARRRFSESVLARSVAAVKNYWQQRIFSGRELPPPELESDEAVVAYVLKHRGAIGYVSGGAKLDRVKPVQIQ